MLFYVGLSFLLISLEIKLFHMYIEHMKERKARDVFAVEHWI
jgi:hypothetical protein